MEFVTYEEALVEFKEASRNEAEAQAECVRIQKELRNAMAKLSSLKGLTVDARIILNKCSLKYSVYVMNHNDFSTDLYKRRIL